MGGLFHLASDSQRMPNGDLYTVLASAIIDIRAKRLCRICVVRVRRVNFYSIGHKQTQTRQTDIDIQVVVGHVHAPFSIFVAQVRRALLGAGKFGTGRAERCFPELAEFVEHVRDLRLIRHVVHEQDHSLLRENEIAYRRPVVKSHGDFRRLV